MTQALIAELRGRRQAHPPLWLMRQAGRYLPEYQRLRAQQPDFLRFCYTPELTIEAALQPIRRFSPDAAILFSDILVVLDALGCNVRFVEGTGPVVATVRHPSQIPTFQADRFDRRLEPVYQSVTGLRSRLPAETALIGFAGSPWTLAVYLVEGRGGTDCDVVRSWAYRDPEAFGRLIDTLTEATAHHLLRQVAAGADAVQLFDSWAGRLSEREFYRWVIRPTAVIVAAVREKYGQDIPIIGFPRGCGALYRPFAVETNVDAVSLDAAVPLAWAATALQTGCAVQGNLDNLLLRIGGDDLDAEVDRICATLANGAFVFNLGHGVLPETPPEHVSRVTERVKAWCR